MTGRIPAIVLVAFYAGTALRADVETAQSSFTGDQAAASTAVLAGSADKLLVSKPTFDFAAPSFTAGTRATLNTGTFLLLMVFFLALSGVCVAGGWLWNRTR